MIEIDGSRGEGGGQILRSALALSVLTGRPFRIEQIRARRKKPGLMRQHLTAVRAAARVSHAALSDVTVGSTALSFAPQGVVAGHYEFAIGTAGSTSLVLQTVLWPLLAAAGESVLVLTGGTHNPMCPPVTFMEHALLPLLATMGADVTLSLERYGFFPAGGGRLVARIRGSTAWRPLELLTRRGDVSVRGGAQVAELSEKIAHREVRVLKDKLGLARDAVTVETVKSIGPGNIVQAFVQSEGLCEVFTACGERGLRAEQVAKRVVGQVRQYLASDAPVGPYLADQLLIPLALAGGGTFRCTEATPHLHSNAEVVEMFLPVRVQIDEGAGAAQVTVRGVS